MEQPMKLNEETGEKTPLTQEELAELREKMQASEHDFNKRNQVNGIATHLFGAAMNGLISNGEHLERVDKETHDANNNFLPKKWLSLYDDCCDMAEYIYKSNEEYVELGRQEIMGGN